jgi:hypothetical protein
MLVARLALVLPLLLAGGVALSQTLEQPAKPSVPEKKSAEDPQEVQKRVAEWLRTCLEDWDRSTHMTKAEWRTTCQRVATDRGRFLADHPNMVPKRR